MKKRLSFIVAALCLMVMLPVTALAGEQPVKNVIILMTDGTGATHTTLARWYKGAPLALDEMVSGAVRTYCADSIITDSAPAATAFATGHKSNTGFIGVLPAKTTMPGVTKISDDMLYKPVASVLEGARLQGKATGLIATSNIQHASPAAYSSHWHDRNNYTEIAEQQVYENIDVVFSSGQKFMIPKAQGGDRLDGENMIDILKKKGYAFVENRNQLIKLNAKKAWGLFAANDLAYEFDRRELHPEQPTLAEMTKKAIDMLSQNKKGFFLFVEGSKVDWASHANDPVGVISDLLAFDNAVKAALDFAKKDGHTLVLAFADHSNGGMSIGNKKSDKGYDKLPLEKVLGPLKEATLTGEGIEHILGADRSENAIRLTMFRYYGIDDLISAEISDIQKAQKGKMNYVVGPIISNRSYIGWTTHGHAGEDVFLYSFGPNRPIGLIENTDIAKISAKALGFNLDEVDAKLFVEAKTGFATIGASLEVDKTDKYNPILIIKKGLVRAELPLSKNIMKLGGITYELNGIVVLSPKTGKVYLPQQAIELFKTAVENK